MAFKNKNIVREGPFFTHFATLPFIKEDQRQYIAQLQQTFRKHLHSHQKYNDVELLKEHNHKLCHVTLFKLVLKHSLPKQKLVEVINSYQEEIRFCLSKLPIAINSINYFTRFNKNVKNKEITVIYLQLDQSIQQMLTKLVDKIMRTLLKEQIIVPSQLKDMNIVYDHNRNLYRPETLHISLFRARNIFEDEVLLSALEAMRSQFKKSQFTCHSLDISTMGEFNQQEFYLPLFRLQLNQNQ